MALSGAGGGDREDAIMGARWRLWFPTMREPGALGASGGHVVDPERAQKCIDELGRIAGDVRRSLTTVQQLSFNPPGFDLVSTNVAIQGGVMAGRAEACIQAWASQIGATREALPRQLDAHREIEQNLSRQI